MPQEIEKKFLVNKIPVIDESIKSHNILQGYVFISESMELRLRDKSKQYFQTIKTGKDLIRGEYEIEISASQFELLWPLTENKRIEKIRYEIHHSGFLIELDIYEGGLEGLITAEVEFSSENESLNFIPPDWFGPEITSDKRYKNQSLAVHGIPE